MPEIQWQDVAYEFIVIPNDEGIPPRQPANDVRLLLLEHAHELAGEGVGVPPFAAGGGSILRSGGGHDAPPPAGVEEEDLRPPRTALASLPLGRTPPKSGALEVESGEPSGGGGMAGGVEPYEVPSWGDPGPRLLPTL